MRKYKVNINKKLREEITERKLLEKRIRESEEKYRKLIETANDAIFVVDVETGSIFDTNKHAEIILGIPAEEIIGMHYTNVHPVEDVKRIKKFFEKYVKIDRSITSEDIYVQHKDGRKIPVEISTSVFKSGGKKIIQGIFRDITKRKKMEETLQAQKKGLERKNIALNEVLVQIELEKKQIKDNVIANVEDLLMPIIQKLMLKGDPSNYVQLLRKNLQELTSSFGIKLTEKRAKLTSREIEICNMVKNGITSKEIARLSNTSFLTIEKHRINIRRKLGIINKGINLASFLKTL